MPKAGECVKPVIYNGHRRRVHTALVAVLYRRLCPKSTFYMPWISRGDVNTSGASKSILGFRGQYWEARERGISKVGWSPVRTHKHHFYLFVLIEM